MTTNFLHEYMINKDSREYLLWLKNLKQFIQKWEIIAYLPLFPIQ